MVVKVVKSKIHKLKMLMRLFISRKSLYPGTFNKIFKLISFFALVVTMVLFFFKMVLSEDQLIFWVAIISNLVVQFFLMRVSWKFLKYHDSRSKGMSSRENNFKRSVEIFDSVNFSDFYIMIFTTFMAIILLFLDKKELAQSISNRESSWLWWTASFLVFNFITIIASKNVKSINNSIIKYWTYDFLTSNILLLIVSSWVFPIFQITPKTYEIYYFYFGFLIIFIFMFFIVVIRPYNSSGDE